MIDKLRVALLRQALMIVVSKLSTGSTPRDGERANSVNCFWALLETDENKEFKLGVKNIQDEGIMGITWNADDCENECCIPNSWLAGYEFTATHCLGQYTFRYSNLSSFLLREIFWIPVIEINIDRFTQHLFNSFTPKRTHRIEVLKTVVEFTIEQEASDNFIFDEDMGTDALSIMQRIHSIRIGRHQDYGRSDAHLDLTLESLIESHDIEKRENGYRAKGKALSTIAQYELENRRHKDRKLQNNLLLMLTAFLAFSSLFQVYLSYKQ